MIGPVVDLTKDRPDLQIRLRSSEVADLVAAHEHGATVINLAERYGIDRTTVLAHLRRQGVPKTVRRTLDPIEVETAVGLYESGNSIQSVARELRLGRSTVGRLLNQAGVTMRSPGRQRSP